MNLSDRLGSICIACGKGCFLLFCLFRISSCFANPFFVLATESHTAAITQADTDSLGRWLVTVSADKTAMVWKMPSGMRESVVRFPIGQGEEGRLDAVAVTPDATLFAVGGPAGIYIVNRAAGLIIRKISPGHKIISTMRWSPGGKYLVVATAGDEGSVMVYNRETGALIGQDSDYDGAVENLEFMPDGRMLTASPDGLKAYRVSAKGLEIVYAGKVHGGAELSSIRLHPDKKRVVVGFCSANKVSVLDAKSFTFLYEAATHGRELNGQAVSVCDKMAWSPDGEYLYRASRDQAGTKYLIDAWAGSGRGSGRSQESAKSSIHAGMSLVDYENTHAYGQFPWRIDAGEFAISALLTVPGSGVVWTSTGGDWGVIGETSLTKKGAASRFLFAVRRYFGSGGGGEGAWGEERFDFERASFTENAKLGAFMDRNSNIEKGIRVSYSGDRVSLTAIKGQRSTFGLTETQWLPEEVSPPVPFDLEWVSTNGSRQTKRLFLSGKYFPMKVGETPRSLAANANMNETRSVYVGSEFALYRINQLDAVLWRTEMPSVVVDLAASGDGRWVVAALEDGTLHWVDAKTGAERLAMFLHPDHARWVIWIPEGHYTASPGAESLIGWHWNQGPATNGRLISASLLYDVFYRPDIVQAKFRGEDISGLITLTAEQALRSPPPMVELTRVPVTTLASREMVCYKVTSTGGGIGEFRLFQNGKLVKSDGFYRDAVAKRSESLNLASVNGEDIYRSLRGLKRVHNVDSAVQTASRKGNLVEECQEVDVIPGSNEIGVVAFNSGNTVQSSMAIGSFYSGRNLVDPHLYVLNIGIDEFVDSSANLKYAAKDAQDFQSLMKEKSGALFKRENIHLIPLANRQATKQGILSKIEEIVQKVKPWDSFILFVASHGVMFGNQYYLVSAGYDGTTESNNLIGSNEIVDISKKIRALNQLFVFDTCHAGGVDNIVGGLYDARMSVLARNMGLHIYASAGGLQEALDGYQGNGLFTHALLDSMKDPQSIDLDKDGKISVRELGKSTKDKTIELANKIGHPQTPTIIHFGRDVSVLDAR